MGPDQLANLRTHTEHLALSLMRETSPDGIIRTPNEDGSVSPDVPATHHLIEVMAKLAPSIFADGIGAAVQWLCHPENGSSNHPFALDSLALVVAESDKYKETFQIAIANRQLKDGSIPVFTAYLPGGDYFSTLWSVKILSRYSRSIFAREIKDSIEYLIARREIGCTSMSQLGFLGLLIAQIDPNNTNLLKTIAEELLLALDTANNARPIQIVDKLFIIEDLLTINKIIDQFADAIDNNIDAIFQLSEEPKTIPQSIADMRTKYTDSLFLETIARSAIVGILRCEQESHTDLALSINRLIHSEYRATRYKALRTSVELRTFLERYGTIHSAFSGYNDKLERAWEKQKFDKAIFLMMPFRSDLKFRKVTEVIKNACKKYGYTAIRVDDHDRRFSDTLWDNLIINMLSCKYAIAVYVSEPVVDRLKKDEVRLFANPNVALEFGFFKSRGQDVLLLKDKASDLASDLQGFLWSEFDIENPDTTLPSHINAWLSRIKASG